MAVAARYLSTSSSYLPVPTGHVISYVRNPEDFKVNRYCQITSVPAPNFSYWELDRDNPVRYVSVADNVWSDGDMRPQGHTSLSNFVMREGRCERYWENFTLGEEAVTLAQEHGAFDPITVESKSCASRAMTKKTQLVLDELETAGSWSTNTETATNLGGARWDAGTSTAPSFKKGVLEAARIIIQKTNGMAKLTDLKLILNPIDAVDISVSAEIHDYLKGSPDAWGMIKGTIIDNPNAAYGLPSRFHNIEIVVEDAPKVTTRPTAAPTDVGPGTRAYAKTAGTALLVYRPGGLDGAFGTKAYSTVQLYYYKYEMAVEMHHDQWNKLYHGGVLDWYVPKIVAWPTGYLVTSVTT